MKLATLILAAVLAAPANAGGPVIVADAYEAEPAPKHDRKIGGLVVGLIVVGALIALANGGGNCNGDDPAPEPTPGPVC